MCFTSEDFSEPLYPEGCVKISQKKYDHLQKYSPYLSDEATKFYHDLPYEPDNNMSTKLPEPGDKLQENTTKDENFLESLDRYIPSHRVDYFKSAPAKSQQEIEPDEVSSINLNRNRIQPRKPVVNTEIFEFKPLVIPGKAVIPDISVLQAKNPSPKSIESPQQSVESSQSAKLSQPKKPEPKPRKTKRKKPQITKSKDSNLQDSQPRHSSRLDSYIFPTHPYLKLQVGKKVSAYYEDYETQTSEWYDCTVQGYDSEDEFYYVLADGETEQFEAAMDHGQIKVNKSKYPDGKSVSVTSSSRSQCH